MFIVKNLDAAEVITSVEEWELLCPPKKEGQWKPGRSACETANAWNAGAPKEFNDAIKGLGLTFHPYLCIPECKSRFDNYRGEPRNHDLLVIGKDENDETVVVAIESKVDESFGSSLEKVYNEELKPGSKKKDRLDDLCKALFGIPYEPSLGDIKYQLLTSLAGLLADCFRYKAKKGVFLVQTFLTNAIDNNKNDENKKDFLRFKDRILQNNVQPFKVPGDKVLLSDAVELYIGKFEIIVA